MHLKEASTLKEGVQRRLSVPGLQRYTVTKLVWHVSKLLSYFVIS